MRRGFTLIEAMLTLVIASVVGSAAVGTLALIMRTTSSTKTTTTLLTSLDRSVQFLARDLENAGGLGMPQAAGILVENSCGPRDGLPNCAGGDRVTTLTALAGPPVCAVRPASRPGALSFHYTQGGCCFSAETATGALVEGTAVLSTSSGLFRPVHMTGIAGSVCEFHVVDAVPLGLALNGPTTSTHNAVAANVFTPFINGAATLVKMRTFFVDPATHELRMREGADTTSVLIADDVFDLQVALGIDSDNDGVVVDAEWAWRATSTPAATSLLPRLHPAREVMVSLVQGRRSVSSTDTVKSPLSSGGSITAPGFILATAVMHVGPANARLGGGP
jgi:prepilin-type N-terminal cleavage/methylation domain-containing protein